MLLYFFFLPFIFCEEETELDDDSIDALVTRFSTFEFDIEEGEVREIQFDRNDVTVVFPPIDGASVTVLASVDVAVLLFVYSPYA